MKKWRYLAIAVSMTLPLAACSSSGSNSDKGESHSAAQSVSMPAGTPIVLGNIGSYSGANASSLGGLSKVIKAWATSVNAAGGINGRPIKLYSEDDAGDPAKALQAVKKLVEVDHVQAIVGSASIQESAFTDYIAKAGIPMVGGLSASPSWRTSPDFFPSGANEITMLAGLFGLMHSEGLHKFGVMYCAESPQCAQLVTLTNGMSKLYNGIDQVYSGKVAATAPNYDAPCLAAKKASVDGLYVLGNATVIQHVDENCAELGLKATPLADSGSLAPKWLDSSSLDGMLIAGANANYDDTSTPGVAAFRHAIEKYVPDLTTSPQFTQSSMNIWAAGKLFEAAAEKAGIGPKSTSADIKRGLYALQNETLDGIAPPLSFAQGKPTLASCYFMFRLKDHKLHSLNDNKAGCLTGSVLNGINRLVGG